MRRITHIVVHCTATQPGATIPAIQKYWREVMGWKSPGYHLIVTQDGTVVRLAPDEATTNGVKGHNATSLHISYIGGIDRAGRPMDTRTEYQKASLLREITHWRVKYPGAVVQGHRDFPNVNKACPSFDARKEYQ
jgi:N-acetylmuramoyl-L-alanine amidase